MSFCIRLAKNPVEALILCLWLKPDLPINVHIGYIGTENLAWIPNGVWRVGGPRRVRAQRPAPAKRAKL